MPIATWSGRSGGKTLSAAPATREPGGSMSGMAIWEAAPPLARDWLSQPMIGPGV